MTPVELSRALADAVRCAVDEGELSVAVPERIVVERPRPGGVGDYASNLALRLARDAGRPPLTVARILRERLLAPGPTAGPPGITDVHITGPGFLNFSLADGGQEALVREVLRRGAAYGHVEGGDGEARTPRHLRIPREPRAAVVADAVRRILRSQGVDASLTWSGATGPAPAWAEPLGIDLGREPSPALGVHRLTPVPAPADPLPLGRPAARWALLSAPAHERPCLDPELLLAQREANPLFRVRYAYSRSRVLVRNARELGFGPEPGPLGEGGDEGALLAALSAYPGLLAALGTDYAPDRLCRHLVGTADAFFRFHDAIRVLPFGPEKPSAAHRARLALAEAAGTVLAGGLSLLGIDAPEHL